jgi:uncharacterized membrane protein
MLGIFVSLSFIFGFVLYKAAREEIDGFASKFDNKKFTILLPKIALPIAGLFGLVLAVSTKSKLEEMLAILVFAAGVIFGSLALRAKERKILKKHMVEVVAFFLIFYFFVLAFLNLG